MSGYFTTDPHEMELRFSNEQSFAFMESLFSEPTEEALATIAMVRDVLDFIPQWEADLIEMFFFTQMRQTDIGHVFKVSQPTVCYRLQRAATRIHFLLNVVHVTEEEMVEDFKPLTTDPFDLDVLLNMFRTTCQSETAEELGSTQSMVRHRFLSLLNRISSYPEIESKYRKTMELIRDNSNILRDVSRKTKEGAITYMILP